VYIENEILIYNYFKPEGGDTMQEKKPDKKQEKKPDKKEKK
jgi:hypothetical protein